MAHLFRYDITNALVQTAGEDVAHRQWPTHALGDGDCHSDLDGHGDFFDVVVLDASENSREDQRIVDLVLEVATATAIDEGSILFGVVREHFGYGVGHGEDDRFFVHLFDPLSFKGPSN